jgi:dihydrodipicolinate synthase/N-acetylneuraminate lyase
VVESRKVKLVGIVVSLPSFCDGEYKLLLDRQRKHIQWLIENGLKEGSAVLMISGGLGEGYFLDDDEWCAMVDVLADAARGEVPTMAGVFELSARRAAKKARYAAESGIDFIQLAPPHYMVPSEDDVFSHYRYVHDAADIGIMAYNIPWGMPKPGFEFSAGLLERFAGLENVVGIKWASDDIGHYLRMLRLFGERFNFIDNLLIFSLGARLGAKGYIDFYANAAPRLSLKFWELLQAGKYDEFDKMWLEMRFDPFVKVVRPEERAWVGVGEGPTSRLTLRALGMESGPAFPAQTEPPEVYLQIARRAIEASGILEWVDWDQSIFDSL